MANVTMLDLREASTPENMTIHPSVITHEDGTLTLVDAGMPGMLPLIRAEFEAHRLRFTDVRRLVLTHGDLDHMGGAAALIEETNAAVLAHERETPFINGEQVLRSPPRPEDIEKMPPELREMLAKMTPERREMMNRRPDPVQVTRVLHDGEEVAPGVTVIETPGHTPGHISLFVAGDATIIAGDAASIHEGRIAPPPARMTPDMNRALASVRALANLGAARLIAYHGGETSEDVSGQLKAIGGE